MAGDFPWKAQVEDNVAKINAKSAQLREAQADVDKTTVDGWIAELLLLKHEVRAQRRRLAPARASFARDVDGARRFPRRARFSAGPRSPHACVSTRSPPTCDHPPHRTCNSPASTL
jgi:hypothetical protein